MNLFDIPLFPRTYQKPYIHNRSGNEANYSKIEGRYGNSGINLYSDNFRDSSKTPNSDEDIQILLNDLINLQKSHFDEFKKVRPPVYLYCYLSHEGKQPELRVHRKGQKEIETLKEIPNDGLHDPNNETYKNTLNALRRLSGLPNA